ncbi:RNA polymerase II transcription factor B subunit 1 [Ceratobasidium sp. AG-Ba]|nr:RNA polymerase II transcription factor B subunit 1 [Ceratobasidium sp. AG-Ba]QRW09562.1 RNA polymerase II transcription factor B subunit 1 [Ceratobasidium sp. AG-Ba]
MVEQRAKAAETMCEQQQQQLNTLETQVADLTLSNQILEKENTILKTQIGGTEEELVEAKLKPVVAEGLHDESWWASFEPSPYSQTLTKRQRTDSSDAQLDMEDLSGPDHDHGVALGLQTGRQMLDNASSQEKEASPGDQAEATQCLFTNFRALTRHLKKLTVGKKPVENAFTSVSQNVAGRVNVNSRKNAVPEDLVQSMGNLQAAMSEFLR